MKIPFLLSALALCACASAATGQAPPAGGTRQMQASADDARPFVSKVNEDLKPLFIESSTADWIKSTYITDDTERNSASANERVCGW
jgi:peptidyl-dipeptidase A